MPKVGMIYNIWIYMTKRLVAVYGGRIKLG